MIEPERDQIYTDLCRVMSRVGEAQSNLYLARFALLAIEAIDDAAVAQRLIAEAAKAFDGAG